MPFAVRHIEIVIIDRGTDTVAHNYPHAAADTLITGHIGHQGIEISDAKGRHYYPSAAVTGMHFTTAPNYGNAHVHLWQDRYGVDGGLYLVDPEQPTLAWKIRRQYLNGTSYTFRGIASQLVEDAVTMRGVVTGGVPLNTLEDAARVATWQHTDGGHVVMDVEQRPNARPGSPDDDGSTFAAFVAGPIARTFIGSKDLQAQPRPGVDDED